MFDSHRRAYTDAYDIRPDFYDTRPVDMWRGSPTSPRARRRQMDEQGLEGEPWIMRQTREREGFSDFSDRLDSRPPPAPEKDLPPPPPHDTPEMSPRLSGDSSVLQTGWEVEEARAAEARQRAIAAEEAARVQMERAREEQARLAAEVAEAERREKERIENEAAARAKWAAEQAARERLDAFERSKLEAAVSPYDQTTR